MGEHESQGKRVRARGRQQSGNPSLLSGTDPEANPDLAVGGGPAPSSRPTSSARPDFRATVGRRLSEERELGPQVLNLISADHSSEAPPSPSELDPSPVDSHVSETDQRDEFIAELAQSMQAALSSAHAHIVEDLDRRRMVRVEALRARAAGVDGGSRDWAEQEIARIERWVEAETQRIRLEGDVRVAARRKELDTRLNQSRTEVERAVDELDAAVADHRAAIDAFLVQVAADPDPAKIARLVEALPPVPSLGETAEASPNARAEAPAAGTGQGRLVGVMADRPAPTGG